MDYHGQILTLEEWRSLIESGAVRWVTPRQICRNWLLLAYGKDKIPLLAGIDDSEEAYAIVRAAGISVREPKGH